jgi:DNA polymerase III epsilon subunit-like protein
MREIVIDTETTGLDPLAGHRVVEVGAVELVDHSPTGRTFHCYLNPERDMPADAVAVHGLTAAFLADKPPFDRVSAELLAFVGDAPLVAEDGLLLSIALRAAVIVLGGRVGGSLGDGSRREMDHRPLVAHGCG